MNWLDGRAELWVFLERMTRPGRQLARERQEHNEAAAELAHIQSLPPRAQHSLERLVAFCAAGCRVVCVYEARGGRLLVRLAGNVDTNSEATDWADLRADLTRAVADHEARAPRWLVAEDAEWRVKCRHGVHPVSTALLVAAVPSSGRGTCSVATLRGHSAVG